MDDDSKPFHEAKIKNLEKVIRSVEEMRGKGKEQDLCDRTNIEKRIAQPEFKKVLTEYYQFLATVQDEEDNQIEDNEKLIHLMKMA